MEMSKEKVNAVLILDKSLKKDRRRFVALIDLNELDNVASVINWGMHDIADEIEDYVDHMRGVTNGVVDSVTWRISILNKAGFPYCHHSKVIDITTMDGKQVVFEKVTASSIKKLLGTYLGSPY